MNSLTFAHLLNPLLRPLLGLDWGLIPPALVPFAIFILRTADLTLATLRVLAVVRGRRAFAWFTGFAQALLFVSAIAGVLANLDNLWNLVAYAAGFATGNVMGITLEAKLAPGHSLLRVISPRRGDTIAENLRHQGRGVTEVAGRGLDGTVNLLFIYVPRREVNRIKRDILQADPQAFVTVENVRELRGGWRA